MSLVLVLVWLSPCLCSVGAAASQQFPITGCRLMLIKKKRETGPKRNWNGGGRGGVAGQGRAALGQCSGTGANYRAMRAL